MDTELESTYVPLPPVQEYNKYEDTFDVFINFIIRRAPTAFVLINMTLMIWMVQTIYSSRSASIPGSFYFFAPYLAGQPLVDIYATGEAVCLDGYRKEILKTFPHIAEGNLKASNLSYWGLSAISFCTKTKQQPANFSIQCKEPSISCSGYCVQKPHSCPITSIRVLPAGEPTPNGFQTFLTSADNRVQYLLSRQSKNTYIVGLAASYEAKCANDYPYFDKYGDFNDYWNQSRSCGDEGVLISEVFKVVDEMALGQYLLSNGIWTGDIERRVKELGQAKVLLGTIERLNFNNKSQDCKAAEGLPAKLKDELKSHLSKQTFTKSMLIIAFIFFTLSWAWLIGYYCCGGENLSKNKMVILMLIIELIVVTFLFSENIGIFNAETAMVEIGSCLETPLQAAGYWQQGITSTSPFKSILYICTVFLLSQIIAYAIDKLAYEPYYARTPSQIAQNNYICC